MNPNTIQHLGAPSTCNVWTRSDAHVCLHSVDAMLFHGSFAILKAKYVLTASTEMFVLLVISSKSAVNPHGHCMCDRIHHRPGCVCAR